MRIEGYEIGEVWRREGDSVLYRARQKSLDRPVIVHVLEADRAGLDEVRTAFADRCRRLAGLLHPHLVSGLACGTVDDRPFLGTESIEGRSIDSVTSEGGSLAEERALRMGVQLARALGCLASAGLIHGDVTPANVLLCGGDVLKLDRIHGARSIGWDGRNGDGRPVGTPGYASPERLADEPKLDVRDDVYALGGVLYFLLAGRSPADDAIGELIDGRMIDRPVPLRARRAGLGKATRAAVGRLMAARIEDRIPDAETGAECLEEAIEEAEQRTRLRAGRGRGRAGRLRRAAPTGREIKARPRRRRHR